MLGHVCWQHERNTTIRNKTRVHRYRAPVVIIFITTGCCVYIGNAHPADTPLTFVWIYEMYIWKSGSRTEGIVRD